MSARYSSLPNSHSAPDAIRELEDAFESDEEEEMDHESAPLTQRHHTQTKEENSMSAEVTSAIPGAYDFERDYDYPPPGSPPRPSARALPNDIGNSNGQLPSSPIRLSMPRPSLFRRTVGAILPTHYTRLPTEAQSSRARGGGVENDGVFANVMAKPQPARVVTTEDGDVHVVPEDVQKEAPPVSTATCRYTTDAWADNFCSPTQMHRRTPSPLTGRPQSMHPLALNQVQT